MQLKLFKQCNFIIWSESICCTKLAWLERKPSIKRVSYAPQLEDEENDEKSDETEYMEEQNDMEHEELSTPLKGQKYQRVL